MPGGSRSIAASNRSRTRRCWSAVMTDPLAAQLAEQPRPRERKSALERGRRHAERIGRFLDAEACEVSQLDDARLLGVELLQPLQRFVERRQHGLLIAGD